MRLPFISNFTDFDALADEEDVAVRYALEPGELAGADAVILPGTKSTIADLRWLRDSGMAEAILALVRDGMPLIGICGGYQMLGRRIIDPAGVESAPGGTDGLGLLEIETTFAGEKRTVRAEGRLTGNALGEAGTPVRGYEIHMGLSARAPGVAPLLQLTDATGAAFADGASARDGQICGSYLHGLFDHPAAAPRLAQPPARAKRASPAAARHPARSDIDRLADHVAAHLDMGRVDRIIGF